MLALTLGCLANGLPTPYADVDVYRLGAITLPDGKSIYHQLPVSAIGDVVGSTYQLLALALLTVRWFRPGTPPASTQRHFEAVG